MTKFKMEEDKKKKEEEKSKGTVKGKLKASNEEEKKMNSKSRISTAKSTTGTVSYNSLRPTPSEAK